MQKLHFSILINAPKEKVWHTMLSKDTYKEWTEVFSPGSHYIGNWSQGSKILFLAPRENGMSGMVSRVRENRPFEYISIEHLGLVQNDSEDIFSELLKESAGALENYTFEDKDGQTELSVDLKIENSYKPMLEGTWPKALEKLKALAEA